MIRSRYIHRYDVNNKPRPHICPMTFDKECECCQKNMDLYNSELYGDARNNVRRQVFTYCIEMIFDSNDEFDYGEHLFMSTGKQFDVGRLIGDYFDEISESESNDLCDLKFKLVFHKRELSLGGLMNKILPEYGVEDSMIVIDGKGYSFEKDDD